MGSGEGREGGGHLAEVLVERMNRGKERCNGRPTQGESAKTLCWGDGIWWQTAAMCHCQNECESSFHLKGELKEGWNKGLCVLDNKRMTEGEKECE